MTSESSPDIIIDPVSTISCSQCGCNIDVSSFEPFSKVECPKCGNEDTVPARLGSFLLLSLLGKGGMGGIVYRAKDETLGRLVAIKVMPASLGENEQFIESFKREAQAAAKINHPNIAQVYSFGQEHGQPYIVMELITGRHFDEMIEEDAPLDQGLILQIALDVANGLSAADEAGLIHGDIKPENILLDDRMNAKVVDFGLATFAHQAASDAIWGTPYYIAPEKIKRRKVDARSDIYCLGATLYHALAGTPPFEGDTPVEVVKARLERPPRPLREVRPDVDERLEAIIGRMLEVDPNKRYPTYASLISDMEGLSGKLSGKQDGKGKKMIIKKSSSKTSLSKKKAISKQSGKIVVHKGDAGPSSAPMTDRIPAGKPKKKSGVGKAILWIVLLLVIVGAIGGGLYYLQSQKKRKMAVEQYRAGLAGKKSRSEELYGEIQLHAQGIRSSAENAEPLVERVISSVQTVLGKTLQMKEKPVEEAPQNEAVTDTNAVPAEVEEGAEPSESEASQEAHSVTNNAAEPNREEEETEVSAEPAETKAETATDDGEAQEAETAGESEATPEPPPEEPKDEMEILAEQVFDAVWALRELTDSAESLLRDAQSARVKIAETRSVKTADSSIEDLQKLLATAKEMEKEAKEHLETATRAADKTALMEKTFLEREEAAKEAAEAAARREAEEAARKREEDRRKAEIEAEVNRVQTLRQECQDLLRQHKYLDAMNTLRDRRPEFETAEGKESLDVEIERYRRLWKLKLFLIDRINKNPFSWGWIQGRASVDILSANQFTIEIRGGKVSWSEVSAAQMMRFLRHYLSDQTVPVRELCEQNVAAAIFCYENGGMEAAAYFAGKAVNMCPDVADEVNKLVPLSSR